MFDDRHGYENKEKEKHYDTIKKEVDKFNEKLEKLLNFDKEEILAKLNINDQIFDNYKYDIYNNLFKKVTEIEKKLGAETKEINTTVSYSTDDAEIKNYKH